VIEVRHYISRAGKNVFADWLTQWADAPAQTKIASLINRRAAGNFGDCKPLRQGLSELHIIR
jgi:putative addiction module killer protein